MKQPPQYLLSFDADSSLTTILRSDEELIERALQVLELRHRRGEPLCSPDQTKDFLRLRMRQHQHEVFGCIYLTQRHTIIGVEDLFTGTIDGAQVHPRVVVQKSLAHNAASLICFHNHPSGNPEPSHADEQITRRLRDALALVDIRLLDHFIVGTCDCVSFAERGLL